MVYLPNSVRTQCSNYRRRGSDVKDDHFPGKEVASSKRLFLLDTRKISFYFSPRLRGERRWVSEGVTGSIEW